MDDNERVRAAFRTPGGLARISGESVREAAQTAVMVVTDRRVLFTADPSQSLAPSRHSYSIPYAEVGAVSLVRDEEVLSLATVDGDRWEFPLPETDPETVDAVVRHLRWVGELRSRLVSCRNDVELATGEISDHVAQMAWDEAEATYEAVRDRVDRLILAVQWTKPIEDTVIAPELTEMERTLERAYAGLFIERGLSQLELATQLVENEDYEQAGTVLQSAREHYQRAKDRLEVVTRGDAFQFGEQRELREDLDRLGWEIEAVAAEPLRQAHEARIRADQAEEPAVALDPLETAFRRYGHALSVALGDGAPQFTGDREEGRRQMATVGERLVSCHRELADGQWDAAIRAEQEGAAKEAIRACSDAIEHLERAEDLAAEFRPPEVEDILERRERIQLAVAGLRETAPADAGTSAEPKPELASGGEQGTGDSPMETGAELELLDIDTHQEITLETTLTEEATEDGVDNEMEDGAVAREEAEMDAESPPAESEEVPTHPEGGTDEDEASGVPIMDALGESDPDAT